MATALLVACLALPNAALALDKVKLQLQWVHRAQFAGFYMAQDMGLYKKAGLEVEIKPGGPGIDPLGELAALRCDFATAWLSQAILLKGKDVPLLHLAQLMQHSALLLVTWADSDIESIQDLQGKRVGLWRKQFALAPRALFHREGISVEEVPQRVTMTPFLERAVDAASAMRYDEYNQIYQAGIDLDQLRIFDFVELGLNFPEDGIYTLAHTWRERPDVCRRFVAASLKGWHLAFAQPEMALKSVMRRIDPAQLTSNIAHQRWMLNSMQKLITSRVGQTLMGHLASYDLLLVNQVLIKQGYLKEPIKAEGFVVEAWRAP